MNPDNGVGGFYTEVWQGLKTRLGFLHDSRPTVPWFFNYAGTQAVSAGKQLIIDIDNGVVAFSTLPGGSGTANKVVTLPAVWGLNKAGSFLQCYDYIKNDLANIDLLVTNADSSVLTGSGAASFGTFPILYSGNQATSLLITGPDSYGGPGAYTATLDPPGSSDCGGEIVWTYPTGCGTQNVSATKSGVSGSKPVMMPLGTWVIAQQIIYGGTPSLGRRECYSGVNYYDMLLSAAANPVYGSGSVWNFNTQQCQDSDHVIVGDGGPLGVPPLCGDLTNGTISDSDQCHTGVATIWVTMNSVTIYQWVCA